MRVLEGLLGIAFGALFLIWQWFSVISCNLFYTYAILL